MAKKIFNIKIRCSEIVFRKLLAICSVTGKTRTAVIEDLICQEYAKDKRYEAKYYMDLEKDV